MSLNLIDFVYFLNLLNPSVSTNEVVRDLFTSRSICFSIHAGIGLYIVGLNPNYLSF